MSMRCGRFATTLASGSVALCLVAAPASAMVIPPEPEATVTQDGQASPAMSAGRAWCACNGLSYDPLWIS